MRSMIWLAMLIATPVMAQTQMTGGWSVVVRPAHDGEVRAAARALVAKLPAGHARLRRIESASRQVVAGMNYRLTVRLADRQRWTGTVWHKLDGTYAVTDFRLDFGEKSQ